MLCGSLGSLMSAARAGSGLGRGKCISTELLESAVGETFDSAVFLVSGCALRASPKPVCCWMRRAFPPSSAATVTHPAVAGDSELSDLVLPPWLCAKSGDLTGDAVACCAPASSPGVLRPPRGTPLPENSWMKLRLDGASCERDPAASPEAARRAPVWLRGPGGPAASKYWPASAPRTAASTGLTSFCWECLPAASSRYPGLVLEDLLSATGGWSRLKLFLVVNKSWVRLRTCAGERYWLPVLSKLYTCPLFSHWIRCLHGSARARKWCWPVPKRTRTSNTRISTSANFSMAKMWGCLWLKRSNTETFESDMGDGVVFWTHTTPSRSCAQHHRRERWGVRRLRMCNQKKCFIHPILNKELHSCLRLTISPPSAGWCLHGEKVTAYCCISTMLLLVFLFLRYFFPLLSLHFLWFCPFYHVCSF